MFNREYEEEEVVGRFEGERWEKPYPSLLVVKVYDISARTTRQLSAAVNINLDTVGNLRAR